jgi:formate dehydrogenase gamma subunit
MLKSERFLRFAASYRIQHWVLLISFAVLAITGLVQVNVDWAPAVWIIGALGGIEVVRLLHHLAAIVLMLETIYHLSYLFYRIFVLRVPMSMLPGVADLHNAFQTLRYNLGLSKTPPYQGFYTFEEKLEYWAVVWGTIVMGVTGFMLWNPIATTRLLPGSFVPAAKMAHRLEALLAVLAILIWHLYHVHLKHFNTSIFGGYISEEEMLDEHPQALDETRAGVKPPSIHPEVLARRRQIFGFVCGAFVVVMLAGTWFFVGYEHTAITTIPPAEDVVVFAPLTSTPPPTVPPTPTPLPATATPTPAAEATAETPAAAPSISWENGISDLMAAKCVACHSSTTTLGGLDLSEYQAAMAGGASGPAIVPGEAHTSLLISRQASGNHPGQLTSEELDLVTHWIELGASEK